ncbi:hypothetical protein FNV43_RR03569 [Rhamnella rubrinervis]|uniref:Uncharacterized protein n=1 Tax=Rhamnella rubrinervis TaxID=2594499 RepID=A0A8K0HK48_9ROSA|nr:hypothetical protein FNV43_RR03569 [Rhamnella rubrinervis]
MSSEESRAPLEPYLAYSNPSPDSTPSLSSESSSIRIIEPDQVTEQNLAPYAKPSTRRDDPEEHRPKFFTQYPVLIKTNIPSIFKSEDMLYLKERYRFPKNVVLSSPRKGERADFVRDRWVYFYEIAFKLSLRLPFHRIINMVLNYFNLAPGQLILNGWRYLLGLIVLSETARKADLLSTLDSKLDYFWTRQRATKAEKKDTSSSREKVFSILLARLTLGFARLGQKENNSIDILRSVGEKSLNQLLSEKSFRSTSYWPSKQKNKEASPYEPEAEPTPESIPLPILEVPYMHILEGYIRLLYDKPSDPLWASYPTVDMGKTKVRIPTDAELAEKERKKKERKAAQKASGSALNKNLESTSGSTVLVQPRDLTITNLEKSPERKQRQSSAPATHKDKGKVPQAPKNSLRLEDSTYVRSEQNQEAEVVDGLMTRHDRVILKGMTFDEISHEAEQCSLMADSALKKKTMSLNKLIATNKSLEDEVQRLKQIVADATSEAEQLEKNWFQANLKRTEKEEELRNLTLDFSRIPFERDDFDDEEGDNDFSEISSGDDETEDDAEGEQNVNTQPKDLPQAPEKSPSPTRDSLIEAMQAARSERARPSANVEEVTSAV